MTPGFVQDLQQAPLLPTSASAATLYFSQMKKNKVIRNSACAIKKTETEAHPCPPFLRCAKGKVTAVKPSGNVLLLYAQKDHNLLTLDCEGLHSKLMSEHLEWT